MPVLGFARSPIIMSVWGKTMTSLGSLFSPLGTNASLKHMFERCVNARTKKEEEWLIKDCLEVVKNRLKDPSTTPSMMIRGLAFVVFANVLGYKSEFASIHAIRLAQLGSLHEKKIGYLSCIFLIKHSDPVSIMMTNTILRDLGSKNILVVAMAASATCYLIPKKLASTVLPLLAEKLHHPSEFLRGKAVVVFHHFLRTCPDLCGLYLETICALLGDRDPCVVGHVMQFLLDVVKINRTLLMKFIPFLINIQDQILTNKLPAVENYRNLPAPWMQMTLLRLLHCSEEHIKEIVTVCHKTLSVLKLEKFPLQEALKIECFNMLIKCEGGEKNLNLTMKYCKELLFSSNSNMRYAGLDLLQNIIQHYHIVLTPDIQEAISRCLKYNDSTVTYKILRLLCVAANEKNVDMICSQVADNVHSCCKDNMHFQIELIKEAIILTEKYPNTNNYWHVAMLIRLLSLAGEKQSKLIQHKIKNALSESTQNVFQARHKVLQILRKYSDSKTASTSVLEIFVWSLSHFGESCLANSDSDAEDIIREIIHLGRKIVKNQIVKSYFSAEVEKLLIAINDALTQISYQNAVHSCIVEYIEEVKSIAVNNSYLHRYCQEIVHGVPHYQELHTCFKGVDWHKEIKGIDFTLSFLDWYVCESLIGGETLYNVKHPKIINPDGSELDSECFLFQDVNYNRDSSGFCPSPLSSDRESCFESGIYEELKLFSAKSSEKEVAEPWIVWSKIGHKQNYNVKPDVEGDIQQIYFIKNFNSSEKPDSLFSQEGEKCKEEQDGEGLDPLDKLLKQDFPKLLLNIETTDGGF